MLQKLYRLWVALLIFSGLMALFFFCVALAQMWRFVSLNEQTTAHIVHAKVKKRSSSRFAIEEEYSYQVGSTTYSGKTIFEKPQFLNRFTAENALLLCSNKQHVVYYMKRNPALSSLENPFPHKRCLQALITLGVFIYFYFARDLLFKFVIHSHN